MHMVDGVLAAPVLLGGAAMAAGGVALGLRRLEAELLPRTALLTAAFFVASLVHVPLGPSNAHLALTGLMGLLLGWAAFPAVLVGLLLQAMLFGYGGITVLGVNTLVMALPAVLVGRLLGVGLASGRGEPWVGFLAGAAAVAGSALLAALALRLSGRAFLPAAQLVLAGHLPVMLVEGAVTASALALLRRVMPEACRQGA